MWNNQYFRCGRVRALAVFWKAFIGLGRNNIVTIIIEEIISNPSVSIVSGKFCEVKGVIVVVKNLRWFLLRLSGSTMGRGRKCHYKSCGHSEVGNKTYGRRCKFFPFPKDPIRTAQWLQLGGIDHLTPKRVNAFNCFICSCHFLNGKENDPVEYVEECNVSWFEVINCHCKAEIDIREVHNF
jgi:hypothetical protein